MRLDIESVAEDLEYPRIGFRYPFPSRNDDAVEELFEERELATDPSTRNAVVDRRERLSA